MFHGTTDEIHIQSMDPKAKIYVDDQPIGVGEVTATVQRDKPHTIQANEQGCKPDTEETSYKFDGVSLMGLLVDAGIISILVVDMGITGAAWKTYPTTYTVTPACPPPQQPM
jgi:hypothetical protein